MVEEVERGVKKGRFSTKSEFFRSLIRLWSEGKLAEELEAGRGELRRGRGKLLRSLKEIGRKYRSVDSAVDDEVMRWTKEFIERYRPALEALAKK